MLIYECVRQQINNIKAAATHTHSCGTHSIHDEWASERTREREASASAHANLISTYISHMLCVKLYICMQHVSRTINVSLYGPHAAAFCPFPSEIVRRIVHETIQSTAKQSEAKQCKVKRIAGIHVNAHICTHMCVCVCFVFYCFGFFLCLALYTSILRACSFVLSDESDVRDSTTKFSFSFAVRMLSKRFCMRVLCKKQQRNKTQHESQKRNDK